MVDEIKDELIMGSNPEKEGIHMGGVQVDVLTSNGLGAGEGTIGVQSRIEDPADPLTPELVSKVDHTIRNDERMLVDVDTDEHGEPIDDDGCGDGRGVIAIFEGREQRSKSLNRPKDFGGAMVMVSSALIGLGRATGESLAQVSASAVNLLKRRRIGFGGHTDPKVHDEHGTGSGCGAIDKAPDHVKTVVEHADYIKAGLAACGVDTTSAVVADTLSNYTDYYQAEVAGKEDQYSGKAVLTANLTEEGKIVKELEPKHREVAVIFNDIEGKTVNQALIREITDNAAQVFAVDVWRLRSIANRAFDDPKEQEQAFVSMLVHTLAVAHVLTAGDLPVYQFTQTPELAAA